MQFLPINHKKGFLIMQVDNSTQPHTTLPPHFAPHEKTHSSPCFPALLLLHSYYQKGDHQRPSITTPSWSLPDFVTHVASLPAELIDMIQAFFSHDDLLALTSVDKAALTTRFCNPRLQHLRFKTTAQVKAFLAGCWETKQTALHTGAIRTRKDFQGVKRITLALSDQLTTKQCKRLFACLSNVTHLEIHPSFVQRIASLGPLFEAAKKLDLQHLMITQQFLLETFNDGSQDSLPKNLWELTTLKKLELKYLLDIQGIPEDIGKLKGLQILVLENLPSLQALPNSLCNLSELEALTLKELDNITALPKEMGQLNALKSLTLAGMESLNALPASLGQLEKLEALNLSYLYSITALPEDMGQLRALKSLTLSGLKKLNALPESFGQMDNLEALSLSYLYSITTLPEKMDQLKGLKVVKLIGMGRIEILPGKLAQIVIRE
jgi:hypothetical protein